MKSCAALLLVGIGLASCATTALADCRKCTIACAIDPVGPQENYETLEIHCNDAIDDALKKLGTPAPKLAWNNAMPPGKLNAAKTAYTMEGSADIIGHTPPHPAASVIFAGKAGTLNIVCPTKC